jgi:putative protein-disulfide isomerase
MQLILFYCYDAYCGWCYGFSPVMKKIDEEYGGRLDIEVLSGGMITGEKPKHIEAIAGLIRTGYPIVESTTGVRFGKDFLWHIFNPEESDWYPDSEKPAIALCIFKEYYPQKQVGFAADLQYALNDEGRDLTDDEAYRHLLEKYSIQPEAFYTKLRSDEYKEKAHYEFALCRQLQVTGYPCVLIQTGETKFHLLARGYTSYDALKTRLDAVLATIS